MMMTDERLAAIVAQCDMEYYVPSSFVYELSDEIKRLRTELDLLKSEDADVLESANDRIEMITRERDELRAKLSCDKSEIEYLNDEIERLRKRGSQ